MTGWSDYLRSFRGMIHGRGEASGPDRALVLPPLSIRQACEYRRGTFPRHSLRIPFLGWIDLLLLLRIRPCRFLSGRPIFDRETGRRRDAHRVSSIVRHREDPRYNSPGLWSRLRSG